MANRQRILLTVFSLAPLLLNAQETAKQKGAISKEGATTVWKDLGVRERFQAPLSLKTKEGKTLTLNVGLRIWSVNAALGRQTLRTSDFTVFRLRAGRIKTIADGKEQVRGVDEYWTLPAGASFIVEVKGETALLETATIATK